MTASAWNEFEQRLACEDSWHADSQALAWPLPEGLAQRLAERNTAALASVAALEERRVESADDDSPVLIRSAERQHSVANSENALAGLLDRGPDCGVL